MDNHTKEIRSYNMSQIRSVNTRPEVLVRKYLFTAGYRYSKDVKDLPGRPDIVLPKYKICMKGAANLFGLYQIRNIGRKS